MSNQTRERDYIAHEFLDIGAVVGECIHKTDRYSYVETELSYLQDPFRCSYRRHFVYSRDQRCDSTTSFLGFIDWEIGGDRWTDSAYFV